MANNAKWFHSTGDAAILEVGSNEVVMYSNDIHPDVIDEIVEMKNDSCSMVKIEKYLNNEEKVVPEEVEYLLEQLSAWDELQKSSSTGKEESFPLNLDDRNGVVEKKDDEAKKEALEETVVNAPVTGKKKGPKAAATTGKKKVSLDTLESSIEDQIKALQEKKQLLTILKQVEAPELPENMTNAGRKLMLELQKEYRQLMDKYAELISEM